MRTIKGHARNKAKKRLFKKVKGFVGGRRKLLRTAKESLVRAGAFAFRDRRVKKREFRKLWIIRINAAAREHGLRYSEFIHGLTQTKLELDRTRLEDTVRALRPALLVLDPFVRLHRVDENASAEVAPLLDFLRGLQRRYQVAVVLVHHARKGASHIRGGQALRGSSELHAWGDSNLYLRRNADDELSLAIEHRAAASVDGLSISLHADGDALSLRVVDAAVPAAASPASASPLERVERILADATTPLTQREIRDLAKIRAASVGDALTALVTDGRIVRTDGRYELARR